MQFVTTAQGTLSGLEKPGCTLFAGVPYAKPPVGPLRWAEPQPPEPWEGVRPATRFPNACRQRKKAPGEFYAREFHSMPEFEVPFSEDCLYLNIWTPAVSGTEKLPVAFWIHGGAFLHGNGNEMEFDGEAYCARGVILVTINYRVGVWGFLAHPLLTAESAHHTSGNYGILDQIAALRWVRENIAAFGGDPDNITVFGQSAGCMSVRTLVSSFLTDGAISKAILQSGLGLSFDKTLEEGERTGLAFAQNAGVQTLTELRALTPEQVEAAAAPILAANKTLPFVPLIDGYVLKASYHTLLKEGRVHRIPYMAGSTKEDIDTRSTLLPPGHHGPIYNACQRWCVRLDALGYPPAYAYYFTRQLPGDDAGAFHSAELWYMFGTLERCWRPMTEADRRLSRQMLDAWTAFMKTGDPNVPGAPQWQPCRDGEAFVMVLDADTP